MKRLVLTQFSLRHPVWVVAAVLVITAFFAAQFPKVKFDNDPENMLSEHEPVRLFHHEVKERYGLYDFVVVGILNETDPDGVFNVDTLTRIDDLTHQLISLHRTDEGRPAVMSPARAGRPAQRLELDLRPQGAWKRGLAVAFRHDPENLFDEQGESVIIGSEIISPSVVDNIRQAELGRLKIEYLMESAPTTREQALAVRRDAMANPLYKGTLVSEDGKALAVYIPIQKKIYSYNVANLVQALTAQWESSGDQVYITGLPVAEDTFGIEMLIQMATSAPMAGVAIFLLLLLFFRRLSLVVAPMIVAVISVISTMGLLIGLGFDIHIMSSMIAIFLMPIAVADSVHILSEFYDSYARFRNKADTLRHIVQHLFMPMLYTSLTTMAGFASLALTPIPPVQIFGLHVAFGVGVAWVLTVTLIPAYIMLAVSEKSLAKVSGGTQGDAHSGASRSRLDPFLEWLGRFSYRQWKAILIITAGLLVVAGYGISRIRVNDNPVKWFTEGHRIRVADRVMNEHFSGTYTAYLTLAPASTAGMPAVETVAASVRAAADEAFSRTRPEAQQAILRALESGTGQADASALFSHLREAARTFDAEGTLPWDVLADLVNYMEPEALNLQAIQAAVQAEQAIPAGVKTAFSNALSQAAGELQGEALQQRALAIAEQSARASLLDFVEKMEITVLAPLFKRPDILRYVEQLQQHLASLENVGKSSSAVDALKKAAFELNFVAPPDDADAHTRDQAELRNLAHYAVPDSPDAVAQVFTQLEGMKKKDSLFHLVTRDYRGANIWVQLTSGDNQDMEVVLHEVRRYFEANPPPAGLEPGWAGLAYINVVWQEKMVVGMLSSLGSSFVTVLIMMMVLFRSPMFGLLSMIPLTVTIALIYGIIGLAGKDYDMPVAVLSSLTLGMSIDFAIHFLQRAREKVSETGTWALAVTEMFKEPAMAISRNAIVIAIGFTPLLAAPLVPYKTVGFFLSAIMAVSWIATLFLLSALMTMMQKRIFKKTPPSTGAES